MSLTTEQIQEILSKVTLLPIGLFTHIGTRTNRALTVAEFNCEVESDEYQVLINNKDEVFEIKNSFISYSKEEVVRKLNPPDPSNPEPAVAPLTAAGTFQQAPTQPGPQITITMPQMPAAGLISVNYAVFSQFIADYIQTNPGCMTDPYSGMAVPNEVPFHAPAMWAFNQMVIIQSLGTQFEFVAQFNNQEYCASVQYNNNTGTIAAVSIGEN